MTETDSSNGAAAPVETRSLIDELIGAVADGDARQRMRILDSVTELFAAGSKGYSSEQVALFDDVLQQIAADIETRARAKLAHRMAGLDSAPPRLIRKLAFDDNIEVAAPVLVMSQQLSDHDLVENAMTKSQEHLLAIAQRLKLSEVVTDVLVERGNHRVARKVAGNNGARLSLAGYGKLTARARSDVRLTLLLGQRTDIPRQFFLKLLEAASSKVRARLERAHPELALDIRDTVDNVATTMQRAAREASREHATAERDAKRRQKLRPISEAAVHAAARAQQFEKAVVALARLGRFSVDLVERALIDQGQDLVLLLAKAAGCSWTTARELLVMYAANRNLKPGDVDRASRRYVRLDQDTAQNIVKFHERFVRPRVEAEMGGSRDMVEIEEDDAPVAPAAEGDALAAATASGPGGSESDRACPDQQSVVYI
jgi:uncharacterized protein (DUF2336 family)